MLARKLQRQATSGAASDTRSVSMRSRVGDDLADDAAAPAAHRWTAWLVGGDTLRQLANTYYASRMALVTLASCLSMVMLCIFSVDSSGFWVWLIFQVTNTVLGVSALPSVYLYSVASLRSDSDGSEEETARVSDEGGGEGDSDRRRGRLTSFSFLRSSFHAIETKLEPFLLKRSKILRLCESIVVVQSVLLYFVVVLSVLIVWVTHEKLWDSSVLSAASGLGAIAVLCVYVQTKEFDRLRAHEQLQLGVGLDQDQLQNAQAPRRRHGSSSRISSVFTPDDSQRLAASSSHHAAGDDREAAADIDESIAMDLGHASRVVEKEMRRGLYEAAVHRDHAKARALLEVMARVLGSRPKMELFLLKMYASPTLWLWSFAFTTHNPLHVACRLGDDAMARVLLEGGMNPSLLDKTQGEPFSLRVLYEICQGRAKNITNVLGTPLHVAVAHGHSHLIEVLVTHGASIDVLAQTSFYSRSMRVPPIFLADAVDVIETLIRHRANFLVVPGKGNSMTVTVLQRAMLTDRADLGNVLKEWGADVALTPLHEAAAAGDLPTVKKYLSLGIPPDQLGEFQDGVNRRTPLHWASVMGRHAVIEELLKCKADVNAPDSRLRTPLHWAARHRHLETMQALLFAGADPHLVDDEGLTPLAFSATGGLLDGASVELFMDYDVDVNAQLPNARGDTCLHLALRNGHEEAALALIRSGNADLASYNGLGEPAIKCCVSAEQLYHIKASSSWVDIVISYDSAYRELAEHLKKGIEESFLTVFMRDADGDAQQSMYVMREASAVVCVLTPGFEHSAICMEELAYAKVIRVPVMAITIESMNLPEELQVYLFTRQLVPFRDAIVTSRRRSSAAHPQAANGGGVDTREFRFKLDEAKFKRSLQNLIDGLRDEVELHDLGDTRIGDGSEDIDIASSIYLPRPGSVRASATTSDSLSRPSDPERGSSPRSSRGISRSTTTKRRTLNDVVRDVLGRRRRPTILPVDALPTTSVFLSHGDCHTDFVAKLHAELRRLDIPVTLDSMAQVSSMKERILAAKDAILQCSIFLVVLSEKSVKTELVSDQLAFAEDKGKHIVPIYYTRRPGAVDTTVRQLLDAVDSQFLIFGNGLSYGRGLDALVKELTREQAALRLVEEHRADSEWVSVSPAAKDAAQRLMARSGVRSRAGNHSILV